MDVHRPLRRGGIRPDPPGLPADLAAGIVDRLRGLTPGGETTSAGVACWDGSRDRRRARRPHRPAALLRGQARRARPHRAREPGRGRRARRLTACSLHASRRTSRSPGGRPSPPGSFLDPLKSSRGIPTGYRVLASRRRQPPGRRTSTYVEHRLRRREVVHEPGNLGRLAHRRQDERRDAALGERAAAARAARRGRRRRRPRARGRRARARARACGRRSFHASTIGSICSPHPSQRKNAA